ncbi:MAG: hypothetical protein ACKN92_09155, partial [Candidatus Nanopelagicaceae bacterium]
FQKIKKFMRIVLVILVFVLLIPFFVKLSVRNRISNEYLEVHINRDQEVREVTFIGHGPRWQGFSV